MGLKYILDRVSSEGGQRNLEDNPEQRAFLLTKINEAAKDVWEQTDLPGSLREVTLAILPNSVVALPAFVGEPRAIRHKPTEEVETINDLRPRYHLLPWKTMWRNWRFIGYSPVQRDVENAAPLELRIDAAESDVIVTVSGSTATARRAADAITMSGTTNTGTVSFVDFESIRKNQPSNNDIFVYDQNGNEMAVIYNDFLESRYIILDVSLYPNFSTDCPDGSRKMELLYKIIRKPMSLDTDSFPVDGFDDVVALKTLELLASGEEGKEQRAILMNMKGKQQLDRLLEHKEGTIQKRVKFARNRFHDITRFRKYGGEPWDHQSCQ